ncbi:MAG: L,D-transpeptidase, partial [Alphaproteobacteria bacterium]
MAFYRYSIVGILLGASTAVVVPQPGVAEDLTGAGDRQSFGIAQLFEPRESRRESFRSYFDEYGRRITVDRRGRIVTVEEPRNDDYEGGSDYFPEAPQDPYDTGAISNDPYGGREPQPSERDYGSVDRAPLPPAGEGPVIQPADPFDPDFPGDGLGNAPQEQIPAHPNPAPAVELPKGQGAKARIAAIQVLLDRIGVSPGVIDGHKGGNVDKAVAAFEEMTGQSFDPLNEEGINASLEQTGGPAFKSYTITSEDAAYPFVASIPEDYSHKAQLE